MGYDKLHIGEVADLFDVTTKTLRHYEELGLVHPQRGENGYRLYGPDEVLRLQRVRQLQDLGLSLRQIRDVMEHGDDEQLWITVLRSLREEVEDEIAALEERKERLDELLEEGILPVQDDHLPLPDKVNDYLEQHLPQASLAHWRQESAVYAQVGRWRRSHDNLASVVNIPNVAPPAAPWQHFLLPMHVAGNLYATPAPSVPIGATASHHFYLNVEREEENASCR